MTMKLDNIHRIVILGHSGFIGGHLMGFISKKYPDVEIKGFSLPEIDLIDFKSLSNISEVLDEKTVVIFCAAIKRQFGDTLEIFHKNIKMIINVCRLLEKTSVGKLIYFSSAAVYGEDVNNTAITERTSVSPTSYYGLAKYTSERLLGKTFSGLNKEKLVVLRPPTIYGPNDLGFTYGPIGFIRSCLTKTPITLWGNGEELREFIFIDDICEIACRLINSKIQGVINIASGESFSFRKILDNILVLTDYHVPITFCQRTKDKIDNIFINDFFKETFTDFTFTPIEKGIKKTYEIEKKKFETI